jgi:hypothetical protein
MRPLLRKIKPVNGISSLLHMALVLVLPAFVFILVRQNFVQLALLVVILSKWRMFAVRPRFWAANVRANAVDLMVGISSVIFMVHTDSEMLQLVVTLLYAVWLLFVKPRSTLLFTTAQAFIGQAYALTALYLVWGSDGPSFGITLLTGLICYLAARHFLDAFDEPYARLLSYVWGYFGAALAWVLCHWLLFYRVVAQPTLLLSALGYGLAVLYYLDHHERLSVGLRRQVVFIMIAVVLVVLAFSDWGNKVV